MLTKEQAATGLQRFWRGHNVRKKHGIKQLPTLALHTFPTFVVGNDPKITGLEFHAVSDEKIAVVGTSGLRALALALDLSKSKPTTEGHIPKLIIIDNGIKVVTFWRTLRDMVAGSIFLSDKEFFDAFDQFISENQKLCINVAPGTFDDLQYENQNPVLYVQQLVGKHGVNNVIKVIQQASILQQTWTDKSLFVVLKNICELNGISTIFAYPSNIAHVVKYENIDKVLSSVEALSPRLSIFTDRCFFHRIPENVILSTKKTAIEFKAEIFPPIS